jgi:uncharacterized cupin superfamily protein
MAIDDQDGTEPHITVRAEIRLMDDDRNQVAARTGDPHYMPEDWQARATVLIQEFRAATALIHDVSAAPPPDPEE